jgi:Xaa-Pro aminopeptidase
VELFGFDQSFANTELERIMFEKLSGHRTLFYDFFAEPEMDKIVLESLKKLRSQITKRKNPDFPRQIIMYSEELAAMRQLKDETELGLIKKAVSITAEALAEVQKNLRPGMKEYEVKALIEYNYMKNGGTPGFGTIVAAGYNATCLHYTDCEASLQATDLLLIDTGCEYNYITSDVTRCYPAGGVFTDRQRAVYEIVLAANKAAIEACIPGANIVEVNDVARRVCAEGLIKLGLFSGTVEELMADNLLDKFFVHKTSHWLGMDAHDAGLYEKDGKPLPFAPGMILTVEPGLYFRKEYSGIDTEFEGIGVRIEDDVLITDTGHLVLTESIPKELHQLEFGKVK